MSKGADGQVHFAAVMRAMGFCVTLTSVISATKRFFSIGLIQLFREYISYYRRLICPLIEIIPSMWHVVLPGWYKDLYTISFILCAVSLKTIAVALPKEQQETGHYLCGVRLEEL